MYSCCSVQVQGSLLKIRQVGALKILYGVKVHAHAAHDPPRYDHADEGTASSRRRQNPNGALRRAPCQSRPSTQHAGYDAGRNELLILLMMMKTMQFRLSS